MEVFKKFADEYDLHPLHRLLHHAMQGQERERDYVELHASDLTKEGPKRFCARERCIRVARADARPMLAYTTADRYTWDLGNTFADLVTMKWLRPYCLGDWRCASCGNDYRAQKAPLKCGKCGCRVLNYREVLFRDPVSLAQGSCDLLIQFAPGQHYRIVELKTIKQEDFKTLEAPLSEHRIRTQLYMELANRDGRYAEIVDTSMGMVLYMTKGGWGQKSKKVKDFLGEWWTPFKVFDVKPADVEYLFDKALPFAEFLRAAEGGATPDYPPGVCKFPDEARARNCRVSKICFGEKE